MATKGLLVIYSKMNGSRCDAARDHLYKSLRGATFAQFPEDVAVLFVPGCSEMRVDYLPFDGVTKEALAELREIRKLLTRETRPWWQFWGAT